MIEDALNGKIDLILTKSVSRFARNTVDSLTTVRRLKDKGVEVYFEKENIYTLDSKGELLITIMSSLAQEESRSISENTTWGQRKRMADGKVSVAYSNFLGYKKGENNGPMEVVEEEAVIVRRIYDEFLAGRTPYDIAYRLTQEGIPTPMKKKNWTSTTIISILTNEKYRGDAILQKTYTVNFLTKKVKRNEGELPMFFVPEDHEAIIRPEVFEMVQEEMQRRKDAGGHTQCISVFSGRIVCAECGGYYGRKVWHAGSEYQKMCWHCNNKFAKRKYCTTPTLKESSIEETFMLALNSIIAKKKSIMTTYQKCLDVITDDSKLQERKAAIVKECGEIATLVHALLAKESKEAKVAEDVEKKRVEYTNRYEDLQKELKEINTDIGKLAAKRVSIEGFLRTLGKLDGPLTKFDPMVWQATLHHMKVYPDCTVTFVFRDGTEVNWEIQNGVKSYARKKKINPPDSTDSKE